ncbi:hypothetical protein GGR51DRAFT_137638 [Nemania sp. FL0031]|nr:hypothetical protein GGR51DRAFT_137638 [Nemania sp. FL0031]
MAIPASGEYRLSRREIKPLRASRTPKTWDGTTLPPSSFHTFHCPQPPPSHRFVPTPKSPASPRLVSPVTIKEESTPLHPNTLPPIRVEWIGPRKRKAEHDGGGRARKLPSIRAALPDAFPPDNYKAGRKGKRNGKRNHAPNSLRTPSMTPEPSESNPFSRRHSHFAPFDSITHELNKRRSMENKMPLPSAPPAPLNDVGYSNSPTHQWTSDPMFLGDSFQQPPPSNEKKKGGKNPDAHCNVKYKVEELDFIRYQRVDHNLKWHQVEANFGILFPFCEIRKAQGLQGVCYRQNKGLPNIFNDQLIFMDNGHVAVTSTKTREQGDNKEKYNFHYLYPDRALKYPWISEEHRKKAIELDKKRQEQKALARLGAEIRGTWVDKLPPEIPCGCCPAEDRETKDKQEEKKKGSKKGERTKSNPTR